MVCGLQKESLAIDPRSTEIKEFLVMVLAGYEAGDNALALAQELRKVKPVPLASRVVLAALLMEAGRLEEALQEAITAEGADPSDPRPQVVLGGIHLKMNNGEAALAAFERVQRCLDQNRDHLPISSRVWSAVARGDALSVLGRHEEAMSAFEDGLRIDAGFFERWPKLTVHYERSAREMQRRG